MTRMIENPIGTRLQRAARRLGRLPAALVGLLLAAALALPVPASAADAPAAKAGATQPAVLYHNYCSVCHGDKGDGKSRAAGSFARPPRDLTSEASRRELTRDTIAHAITYGRPGTAMVAWKSQLSEGDIAQLADWVYTQFVNPPETHSRGRELYAQNCSVCHGDKGAGAIYGSASMAVRPRNFTAPEARNLSRDAMIAAVTNGKAGTAMVGFGARMSASDIASVVDYVRAALMGLEQTATAGISGIRAHGGREGAASVGVDMNAAFPKGLKGDAKRGQAFYLANCATCHGTKGDGQGPRAYFINPPPRVFTSEPARAKLNRPTLFEAVSEGRLGTEMPAWSKVSDDQQMADVAEYVFQTFIRTAKTAKADSKTTGKR